MIQRHLPRSQNSILAIGNFDGVHRGHQHLFNELKRLAKTENLTPWVMIFEPQPKELFLKDNAPARLTQLRDKISLMHSCGLSDIICLNFKSWAAVSATDFMVHIHQQLGLKHLVVGEDFRFGKAANGDIALLQKLSRQLDFDLSIVPQVSEDGVRISSSLIREAMHNNNWRLAQKLLGHPYCISGHIIHGNKQGRLLGFPTINIVLKQRMAVHGVYAVTVKLDNQLFFGVANVGRRPTFIKEGEMLLEVYLFDFNGTCYGRIAQVEFIEKIRDEVKFASLDALKVQIAEDVAAAKAIHVIPFLYLS